MPAAPVRPFRRVTPHVALSSFAERALTDEDTAELERLAAARDVTVGIVMRRDHLWLGRVRDRGQAVARTAYEAGRLALEGIDCE